MVVQNSKAAMVLQLTMLSELFSNDEERTYTRDAKRSNETLDRAPESLAAFAVGPSKAFAFPRVLYDLTSPLVAVCVEDGECEQKPVDVFGEETVLKTAAVKLATDIVQESHSR